MIRYHQKILAFFLVSFIVLACKPGNANEQTNQIFSAVIRNDLKEIRYLIARGADVNCRDLNNVTPLALSSRLGRGEVSALLLDMGADANVQSKMNEEIGDGGYIPPYCGQLSTGTFRYLC